jgi:hypothetical protein
MSARDLLPGVWDLRTFASPAQTEPLLERLNLTAVPSERAGQDLVLQGAVHAPEGKTWGALPVRELRVEFAAGAAAPAAGAGLLLERVAGSGEWQRLCDFSFRAAGEGALLSASPAGCTWALRTGAGGGANASAAAAAREWVLSAAVPRYALQHGARRPDAGAPATLLKRYGALLLLPVLLLVQGTFKYLRGRLMAGSGGAGGGKRRAAGAAGGAQPAAEGERERTARREAVRAAAAVAAAQGSSGAGPAAGSASSDGPASSDGSSEQPALPPTDAAAKRAL